MASTVQNPDPSRPTLPQTEVFWARLAPRDRPSRWRYPRVHANVPVRISLGSSPAVELTTNDLSTLGLQVRCDRRTAARLRPDPATVGTAAYSVAVRLSINGTGGWVTARARLAHLTVLSGTPEAQEIALGFELGHFENGGAQALERFVAEHLRPDP